MTSNSHLDYGSEPALNAAQRLSTTPSTFRNDFSAAYLHILITHPNTLKPRNKEVALQDTLLYPRTCDMTCVEG